MKDADETLPYFISCPLTLPWSNGICMFPSVDNNSDLNCISNAHANNLLVSTHTHRSLTERCAHISACILQIHLKPDPGPDPYPVLDPDPGPDPDPDLFLFSISFLFCPPPPSLQVVNTRVTPPVGTECRWTVTLQPPPSARTSSTTTQSSM